MPDAYRRLAVFRVLPRGAGGCTVFCHGEALILAAPAVVAAALAGAGDIFAGAYLVRFRQTDGNPWEAAEFANRIAAKAVTRRGLPAKTAVVRQLVNEQMHSSAGW